MVKYERMNCMRLYDKRGARYTFTRFRALTVDEFRCCLTVVNTVTHIVTFNFKQPFTPCDTCHIKTKAKHPHTWTHNGRMHLCQCLHSNNLWKDYQSWLRECVICAALIRMRKIRSDTHTCALQGSQNTSRRSGSSSTYNASKLPIHLLDQLNSNAVFETSTYRPWLHFSGLSSKRHHHVHGRVLWCFTEFNLAMNLPDLFFICCVYWWILSRGH